MVEEVLGPVLVRHRDGRDAEALQLGREFARVLQPLQPPRLLPTRALLHAGLGVTIAREERHTFCVDKVGEEVHELKAARLREQLMRRQGCWIAAEFESEFARRAKFWCVLSAEHRLDALQQP